MATFDQRNQKVKYQYNAAGDINFGTVKSIENLGAELTKLVGELQNAVKSGALDSDIAIDVEANIKKAAAQCNKPEPNKSTVVQYLEEAKSWIGGIASAAGLVKGIMEAVEVARHLL